MFDEAITYAERHTLHALLIAVDGEIAVTRAGAGREITQPHALYSGTKSFWGITAAAAAHDGLLELDEPIGKTIDEWPARSPLAAVTIRQLLTLTAGYAFGGMGNAVPTPERALEIPLKDEPGAVFTYGGIPLQVFGEVLRRKVAPRYASPHAYLEARVLARIGMTIDRLAAAARRLAAAADRRIRDGARVAQLRQTAARARGRGDLRRTLCAMHDGLGSQSGVWTGTLAGSPRR